MSSEVVYVPKDDEALIAPLRCRYFHVKGSTRASVNLTEVHGGISNVLIFSPSRVHFSLNRYHVTMPQERETERDRERRGGANAARPMPRRTPMTESERGVSDRGREKR